MITNTSMLCYGITMLLHITNTFFLSRAHIPLPSVYNFNAYMQQVVCFYPLYRTIRWTSHHESMKSPDHLEPHSFTCTPRLVSPSISVSALIIYTKMLEFQILHHQTPATLFYTQQKLSSSLSTSCFYSHTTALSSLSTPYILHMD